jgi:predicted phage terminase large subunit-like protein
LLSWAPHFFPDRFAVAPSRLHRWLAPELDSLATRRGRLIDLIAPRGSGKSEWCTFAYPLRELLTGREPYVWVISDSSDQAWELLRPIRLALEGHPRLAAAYPGACGVGPAWRHDRLELRNGAVVQALGTGARIRGRKSPGARRPTLILIDDPQGPDEITSPVRRERDLNWLLKDVLPAGEPGHTNVVMIGTALHRQALVCEMQQPKYGWASRAFKALDPPPPRPDLWREWQEVLTDPRLGDAERSAQALAFFRAHPEMADPDCSLWPDRQPLYWLMQEQARLGPAAFASEYLSDPFDPASCEWPPQYFDHPLIWFDEWPSDLAVRVIALDPSKGSDSRRGDYSAIVAYGRATDGTEYVAADQRRDRDAERIVADTLELYREFGPELLAVESDSFQYLFKPIFEAAVKARGMADTFRFLPLATGGIRKEVRIRRHTGPLAARRVRFKARSPGTQLLVQQLRDFPNGDHDDGCDSWEYARRAAAMLWNGDVRRRPG